MKFYALYLLFPILALAQTRLDPNWVVYNRQNSPLNSNNVNSVVQDKNGTYWIGLSPEKVDTQYIGGGLARFDGVNWKIYTTSNSAIPSNIVNWVAIDSIGSIWLATGKGGVAKFDGIDWQVFNISNSQLPSNDISYITVEKTNIIWIGTLNKGVVKFDGSNWSVYHLYNYGFISDIINFIEIDERGKKWIGTDLSGLISFDNTKWVIEGKGLLAQSINLSVQAMAFDKTKALWIAGINYAVPVLAQVKDTIWTFYDSTMTLIKPFIAYNGIAVDKYNNKWITTRTGLLKYNNDSWKLYSKINSPLPVENFGSAYIDRNNNLVTTLWNYDYPNYYSYGLWFFNENGVTITDVKEQKKLPVNYSLQQNFPNPFNPTTTISYQIPGTNKVTLKVFDVLGREIANLVDGYKEAGSYDVKFDAGKLPSGVYFYRLEVGRFVQTKKMILAK